MYVLMVVFMMCGTPDYLFVTDGIQAYYGPYDFIRNDEDSMSKINKLIGNVPEEYVTTQQVTLPYQCTNA